MADPIGGDQETRVSWSMMVGAIRMQVSVSSRREVKIVIDLFMRQNNPGKVFEALRPGRGGGQDRTQVEGVQVIH